MTLRGAAILILGLAGVGLMLSGWWWLRQPEPEVPVPLAAPGGFVGIETCASCHASQAADHAKSGHARTFAKSTDSEVAKRWHGKTFADPERNYEYHYQFGSEGLSVTIPARFGETSFPLDYVFGSGRHAVSFLTLVPNRAGETDGVEHRVTSYSHDEHLALTPGHRNIPAQQKIEEFGMVHLHQTGELDRCVECHTTSASVRDGKIENLLANVTCESCHGPGEAHVRAQRKTGKHPPEIAANWTAQTELEMCGRCHRRTDWLSKPPDKHDYKIVRFQPVGLSQSRCFQESNGQLKCSTCHDPHRPPVEGASHYDHYCLACHTKELHTAVRDRDRLQSNCASCHMPPIEVHPGFVFSDHWIRVRHADDLPAYSKPRTAGESRSPED